MERLELKTSSDTQVMYWFEIVNGLALADNVVWNYLQAITQIVASFAER